MGVATWLSTVLAAAVVAEHRDVVALDARHQVLENFGASDCWTMQKVGAGWSEAGKTRLADLLFDRERGIGLSCWRFNLGAGGNRQSIPNPWRTAETFETGPGTYDWTRQAGERWFLRAAKARGVPQFLAFACSPPGRLTRNGLTNGHQTKGPTNLKPGAEGEFARYLVDIVKHFRDHPDPVQRVAFDYLSPLNEPEWEWNWGQEGCHSANDELRAVLVALHAELARQEVAAQIIAPEAGSLPDMWQTNAGAARKLGGVYGDYLGALAGDARVRPTLGGRLAYHSYWSDDPAKALLPHRQRLRQALDRFPGLRLWQTEYCVMQHKRDLTMATALDVARVVHLDLTVVGVTAWQWWLALSPSDYKDGLLFTTWQKPGDEETILVPKLFWAFGHYSRFVRPGMVRVELRGDGHGLDGVLGSAWLDPRDGTAVAVYLNRGDQPARLRVRWQQAGAEQRRTVTPHLTTDRPGDDLRPGASFAGGEAYELPAKAMVTLVAR